MKRDKIIFLIAVLILAVGLGWSWNELLKIKNENQRSIDYMEIQNVFAKHSYYYAAQKQWTELDTIWAKKRDDITYGHNNGYYYGRESVESYYGKMNDEKKKKNLEMISKLYPEVKNIPDNLGVGALVMHTLTTPVIEIADDGATAKGVWMSIGLGGRAVSDGTVQYNLLWEKFGVDFVKEDGEWKIWHLQVYSDTMFNIPENMWGGSGGVTQGGAVQVQAPAMDKLIRLYETHSSITVPKLLPELPAPYETWEDTIPY